MKHASDNKKNKYFLIAIIFIMVCAVIGVSYGYWNTNIIQQGENITSYSCFEIAYDETNQSVIQLNSYPQSDSSGMNNTPYVITITNTCSVYSKYQVTYNVLNTSTLSPNYVKVSVNNDYDFLTNYPTTTSTLSNAFTAAYIIYDGYLQEDESITLYIRNWMDYETTTEQGASTTFETQVSVEAYATSKDE